MAGMAKAERRSPTLPSSRAGWPYSATGGRSRNIGTLPGYNYRMDAIQGAVLKVKMNHIESWTEARRSVAAHYGGLLANSRCQHRHRRRTAGTFIMYTRFGSRIVIACKRRSICGVGTSIHYPIPVHLQSAYADLGYRAGDLPVTETAADQFLSLPIYPELRSDQLAEIATRWTERARSIPHRRLGGYRCSDHLANLLRVLETIVAELKGKRVLVTGGAGFIGSHIVDLLADQDCREIVVLDNMVRGRPENLEGLWRAGWCALSMVIFATAV